MLHCTFALIGQRICRLEETCKEGNGTYLRNGYIYSSLAGYLHTSEGEGGKVVAIVLFCTSTIFLCVNSFNYSDYAFYSVQVIIIVHVSFFLNSSPLLK